MTRSARPVRGATATRRSELNLRCQGFAETAAVGYDDHPAVNPLVRLVADQSSFAASSAIRDRTTSFIVRCAKHDSPLNRSTTCTRPFDSESISARSI